MKRVRFETVPIGGRCQTEYKENIMKTEKVRIYTDGNINYRNAVNLDTGELMPVDFAQWVLVEMKSTSETEKENDYCEWFKYDYSTIAPRYHDVNNPYWRIPENMDKLKYCPYCGKEIRVID